MSPGGSRGGSPGPKLLHEDDVGGEELCHGGGVGLRRPTPSSALHGPVLTDGWRVPELDHFCSWRRCMAR